jgi:hypothetical protein
MKGIRDWPEPREILPVPNWLGVVLIFLSSHSFPSVVSKWGRQELVSPMSSIFFIPVS